MVTEIVLRLDTYLKSPEAMREYVSSMLEDLMTGEPACPIQGYEILDWDEEVPEDEDDENIFEQEEEDDNEELPF